jgi:hypothetical protein
MREWVEGGCRQSIEVEVASNMRHVRGETKDRSEWTTVVTSNAPEQIESEGVRKRIEGVGVGCRPAWAYANIVYEIADDGKTAMYMGSLMD